MPYPTTLHPFGVIGADATARSAGYKEQTAIADLISEVSSIESDLINSRGASATLAARLTVLVAAIAAAQAAAQATSQPLDSDLTAIAALTTSTIGRSLLAIFDATAGRTVLGLGSAATASSAAFDAAGAATTVQANLTTLGARFGGNTGPTWTTGVGSPEGVVTAIVGSLYSNTSGGVSTTLYVKTTGAGNTGWIAK